MLKTLYGNRSWSGLVYNASVDNNLHKTNKYEYSLNTLAEYKPDPIPIKKNTKQQIKTTTQVFVTFAEAGKLFFKYFFIKWQKFGNH